MPNTIIADKTETQKSCSVFYFIALWLLYAVTYALLKNNGLDNSAGWFSFITPLILDTISVAYAWWLWKNATAHAKRIFGFFLISFIAALLLGLTYQIPFGILRIPHHEISNSILLLIDIPYIIFLAFQLAAFGAFFPVTHPHRKKISYLFIYLPIFSVVAILGAMFLITFQVSTQAPSLEKVNRTIELILQSTGFIVAIFCLNTTKNRGLFYLASSHAITLATSIIINTSVLSITFGTGHWLETLWILGTVLRIYGLVSFKKDNSYATQPNEWTYGGNNLKSQVIFWSLMTGLLAIGVGFFIASPFLYQEHLFNNHALQTLAVIFVTFSILWSVVSNLFSTKLYAPLNRLETLTQYFIEEISLPRPIQKVGYEIHEFNQIENLLQKAFQTTQEKIAAEKKLSQFAKEAAHDIRSPLTALQIMLQQIPHLTQDQQNFFKAASKNIDEIAQGILRKYEAYKSNVHHDEELPHTSHATIEQSGVTASNGAGSCSCGKMGVTDEHAENIAPVAIADAIKGLVRLKHVEFSSYDIELAVSIAPATQNLMALVNKAQLQRALSNIINNAADAIFKTDQAHGKIEVALDVDEISTQGQKNLMITISDNGCGMPQKLIDKLGSEEVTLGKHKGHGIGLYSAIQNIKRWGGAYEVMSTMGEGTRFMIYLPCL
jgi:signal transduction histidine kinase